MTSSNAHPEALLAHRDHPDDYNDHHDTDYNANVTSTTRLPQPTHHPGPPAQHDIPTDSDPDGSGSDSDTREREATELHHLDHASLASRRHHDHPTSPLTATNGRFPALRQFWRRHVRISVPHVACRDHLANERTFLGYLRTSLMLSMLGTFIAQFYRLELAPPSSRVAIEEGRFGYFAVSKPLAAVFQVAALGTVVLGSTRFWRQQGDMAARGKVVGGGWEVMGIGAGVFAVSSHGIFFSDAFLHG